MCLYTAATTFGFNSCVSIWGSQMRSGCHDCLAPGMFPINTSHAGSEIHVANAEPTQYMGNQYTLVQVEQRTVLSPIKYETRSSARESSGTKFFFTTTPLQQVSRDTFTFLFPTKPSVVDTFASTILDIAFTTGIRCPHLS